MAYVDLLVHLVQYETRDIQSLSSQGEDMSVAGFTHSQQAKLEKLSKEIIEMPAFKTLYADDAAYACYVIGIA